MHWLLCVAGAGLLPVRAADCRRPTLTQELLASLAGAGYQLVLITNGHHNIQRSKVGGGCPTEQGSAPLLAVLCHLKCFGATAVRVG